MVFNTFVGISEVYRKLRYIQILPSINIDSRFFLCKKLSPAPFFKISNYPALSSLPYIVLFPIKSFLPNKMFCLKKRMDFSFVRIMRKMATYFKSTMIHWAQNIWFQGKIFWDIISTMKLSRISELQKKKIETLVSATAWFLQKVALKRHFFYLL